jgi:hypothetical protein
MGLDAVGRIAHVVRGRTRHRVDPPGGSTGTREIETSAW